MMPAMMLTLMFAGMLISPWLMVAVIATVVVIVRMVTISRVTIDILAQLHTRVIDVPKRYGKSRVIPMVLVACVSRATCE